MKFQIRNLGDLLRYHNELNSIITEVNPVSLILRSYTTEQLELNAQSLANHLSNVGYRPQDRIAIIADNCLESIICYLAILKLGGIVVMISPKLTAVQITQMLTDTNVKLVFTDRLEMGLDRNTIEINKVLDLCTSNILFESYSPDDSDTAIMLHTSGSTGQPSRVQITHKGRLTFLNNMNNRGSSTGLFANPMYHSMGMNILDMYLYNKNDLIFLKKFDPIAYLKTVDQMRPTTLTGVPPMFSIVMLEQNLIQSLDLSSVTNIVLSGGATTESLYDQLTSTFKNAQVQIAYGSTELGPGIFGPHPTLPKPPTSVGCEKDGILYRLVDNILQVKSPSMMKGYEGKTDNFTHDGYYITNDQFRIDENGFYYFVGRSDDMFKSGGNKIFPSEIERVVEQHPAVDKCVTIPVKDPIKEFKPYAFVTLKPNTMTTSQDLIDFLDSKLAHYQQPRQIWILDSMPLSAVNKIDKQRLKILAEQNLNI